MPKLKTHSGAKKRVKKTGTGKYKRGKGFTSHIKTSKSPKRKRNLRKATLISPSDEKRLDVLLPN